MINLSNLLGIICFIACELVANWKYGIGGVLLVVAASISAAIYFSGDLKDEDELEDEPEHDSCEGCKHNLGGGCCELNSEDECAAGGGYELYSEVDDDE